MLELVPLVHVAKRLEVPLRGTLEGLAVRVQPVGAVDVAQLAVVYVCGALHAPATPALSRDATYQVTLALSLNPQE